MGLYSIYIVFILSLLAFNDKYISSVEERLQKSEDLDIPCLRLSQTIKVKEQTDGVANGGETAYKVRFKTSTGDEFEFLPFKFSTSDHIAFAKNLRQQKHISVINNAIKELNNSGEIEKIIEQYAISHQ